MAPISPARRGTQATRTVESRSLMADRVPGRVAALSPTNTMVPSPMVPSATNWARASGS